MMVVAVETEPEFHFGTPKILFEGHNRLCIGASEAVPGLQGSRGAGDTPTAVSEAGRPL